MSDLIGWRHRWIEGKLVHPGGQLERGKWARTISHKLIYSECNAPEIGANGEDQ
jgi:hypothetical protein